MGLALDEPKEKETLTNINGIDVLVSPEVQSYAGHSVVDYLTSPYGEGFTVRGTGC